MATTIVLGYLKFHRRPRAEATLPPLVKSAGRVMTYVLLAVAGVLLIAGAAYGTYAWQHRQVDQLQQQVAQLTTKLDSVKKQQTESSQAVKPTPAPAPAPAVTDTSSYVSGKGVNVKVYTPARNGTLSSPTVVMGEVPGTWSFEASFPVRLLDANGRVVTQTPAHLIGDWMTDKPVPFTVTLTYKGMQSGVGKLVLQKDNPSGLPANDDSVTIPVKFGS